MYEEVVVRMTTVFEAGKKTSKVLDDMLEDMDRIDHHL
jgi:hypothetical protein